jgi:hypothetical protein
LTRIALLHSGLGRLCKLADVKAILIIAAVVVVAATVFADYKWRRWMAARRADHEASRDHRA